MKKLRFALLSWLAYPVLAALSYLLYIRLFAVDVVLYAALAAAALALALQALLLCCLSAWQAFSSLEKCQHLLVCALTGYALALSVPTVIDRSLSFYILEKLQQRGGGIARSKMDQVFKDEYMREHRLIDIRLTEQLVSGTIRIDDQGCVLLTPRGEGLAQFSRWFRHYGLPHQRLIGDRYSADLVDPFAHSQAAPDYRCH
ncbi:hypothetical protein HS961_12005 [Comamonas piscis]|uniref:Uncharacterized protein n=1 Tax=Comamonas piscis TaxID=1562974 RepID=A0A7G5EHL4_9BURK|nr:hypothetical protein [Comamonas piscis]QMV73489.1 hypothetical protein HS961_12005 [Comamonas piscis]WSO31906.1 hypothetical protein VUJ63_12040 [Comamonas piscis]